MCFVRAKEIIIIRGGFVEILLDTDPSRKFCAEIRMEWYLARVTTFCDCSGKVKDV